MKQEQYCENCGKSVGEADRSNFGDPPRGKRVSKGGFAGVGSKVYYVCSDRCKRDYEEAHSSDSDSKSSSGGGFLADLTKEDTPEQIAARAEADRIKAEQERIDKENRLQKANEYRSQGKPTMAFVTQFSPTIGTVALILGFAIAFFLIAGFGNEELWMIIVGFILLLGLIVPAIILGTKYIKEYFRKPSEF